MRRYKEVLIGVILVAFAAQAVLYALRPLIPILIVVAFLCGIYSMILRRKW